MREDDLSGSSNGTMNEVKRGFTAGSQSCEGKQAITT